MGKRIILLGISICILCLFGACKIKSNSKMSDKELDDLKSEYEKYLSETYPGETFTIEVWQEYGETTGSAGLPDYEGYLMKQVITDSKGNRFKIFTSGPGKYSDDYQKVLDGTVHYNEKGEQEIYDENGKLLFTY